MSAFSQELVEIRKKANLSQEYMAKKLGFTRSYICKLESGERKSNTELVKKIAAAYNLDNFMLNKLLILGGFNADIDNSPESYQLCLKLIIDLKENRNVEEAYKLIEKCMKIFEHTVEILALLANLYLLKNEYEKAITTYEDAIKYYPETKISFSKPGIKKGELIHNLGYVFFEKGLKIKKEVEQLLVDNTVTKNDSKNKEKIDELRKEVILNIEKAIEKFEEALTTETNNEHIVEQLARAYLNRASIDVTERKAELLKKAVEIYDTVISFPTESYKKSKRLESCIFLAMSFAKLYDLKEAERLINFLINCYPEYSIAYYARACIYSINGKDNVEILQLAYDNLKYALELNTKLKNEILYDIDLLVLRMNPLFEDRFINLCKKNDEEKDSES